LRANNDIEGGPMNGPTRSTAAYRLKFGIGSDSGRLYLPHDDANGAAHEWKEIL